MSLFTRAKKPLASMVSDSRLSKATLLGGKIGILFFKDRLMMQASKAPTAYTPLFALRGFAYEYPLGGYGAMLPQKILKH